MPAAHAGGVSATVFHPTLPILVSAGADGQVKGWNLPLEAKLVKDKPFAAEAVTETVQVLTDGNRIVRRNLTREYRDRSGRTRREQTIESLGPSSPVASLKARP